jgi:alanyl-tRNA synthetase
MDTDQKKKAHTGEHILFRALSTVVEGLTVKKVELGKRNYFKVHYDEEFQWTPILKAELLANQIVREGRPVKKIKGSKEEIKKKFPHLRVRWDRIKDQTITVVEIEDYDWAACVGDHVENTKDIEYILITRINSVGKGYYEVEFAVADKAKEEALRRSALTREISSVLKTSLDKVVPTVKNLKKNCEELTASVRMLTERVIDGVIPEEIEGISVYLEDVSGGDRTLIQRKAARLVHNNKSLVVFLEQSINPFLIIAKSPSIPLDCRILLNHVVPDVKGGGKPEYVIARSPSKIDREELTMKIRQFLEQLG